MTRPTTSASSSLLNPWLIGVSFVAVFAGVLGWSYWPTLLELQRQWTVEPDYSHGFLVAPIAMAFLWMSRDLLPVQQNHPSLWGLVLLFASLLLRYVGVRFSLTPVDGYALIVGIAGVVWLLGGAALLRWSAPAILFLLFMVPLPFRFEYMLSQPLQNVATSASCYILQCLGQPAFAERTTILLNEQQLKVEQTCSGLRIFMSTVALAVAYGIAFRSEWWEKITVLLAAIPIAVIANVSRIVITGLLYQFYSDEAAKQFSHDIAGVFMIPYAVLLFAIFIFYLNRLIPETQSVSMSEVVHRTRTET